MLLISNALVSSSGFRHRDKERRVVSIYDTHNKCASFSARLTALWRNSTGCACLCVYVTTAKKHLLCHICTKQCAKWLNTVQTGQICLLTLNTTHTHTQPLSHNPTHTHTHTHCDHRAAAECAWDACSKLIRELGCHSHLHQTTTVYCMCVSMCAWVNECVPSKKKENK